jgi:hypothetical protein
METHWLSRRLGSESGEGDAVPAPPPAGPAAAAAGPITDAATGNGSNGNGSTYHEGSVNGQGETGSETIAVKVQA